MKPLVHPFRFRPSVLALAVLAAFGPAFAAEGDLQASVTAGVALQSGDNADRALWGQYNGLRNKDAAGLLDFSYSRRDAATGTWSEMIGNNLLLDTRELALLWKRQGNWRVSGFYNELTRVDPNTVNTAMLGAGRSDPIIALLATPGTGSDVDLKTKRKTLGAGFAKWLTPQLEFTADLQRENKDGARLFGVGFACPSAVAPACGPTSLTNVGSAVLLTPEPIDSSHTQAEARLNWSGTRALLSIGYYGSFYRNAITTLNPNVPGTLNNPVGSPLPLSTGLQSILSNPVALAPDNNAHHFDLTGNYAFGQTGRANFKVAYGTARQNQDFSYFASPPAGDSSLHGRVDTTVAQIGFSGRPVPKLSLLVDWRYEDREDKTPVRDYVSEDGFTYTNRLYSRTKIRSKAQATYQLPGRVTGTAGLDYEFIDRGTFTSTSAARGVSALRQETEEVGYRLELRRQITETFGGSIAYIASERTGSNWWRPNGTTGVTEVTDNSTFPSTAIFSPNLADRKREKVKLAGNWQATEALSLTLTMETGNDRYDTPTSYSVRRTKVDFFSLDANYVVSEEWSVNGYVSEGRQQLNQARPAGSVLGYDNKNTAAGFGVQGKPTETLDVGASLAYIRDKSVFDQGLDPLASLNAAQLLAASGGLPQIEFQRTEFRLFGNYALSDRSALRLDAVYQRARFNDWAYVYDSVPFTFSDNTTVFQQPVQKVGYLGVSYRYSWR